MNYIKIIKVISQRLFMVWLIVNLAACGKSGSSSKDKQDPTPSQSVGVSSSKSSAISSQSTSSMTSSTSMSNSSLSNSALSNSSSMMMSSKSSLSSASSAQSSLSSKSSSQSSSIRSSASSIDPNGIVPIVNSNIPSPKNLKAFGDDRNIIVTWDSVAVGKSNPQKIIGYYISYRLKGTTDSYKIRQQMISDDGNVSPAIQLQPLENGMEYEINVQTVVGTWIQSLSGPLAPHDTDMNNWPVADGKVSPVSTIYAKPSSARVDAMRTRLTRFFDDFNVPAGPFDELKWNTADTNCSLPGFSGAFINDQFHAHNQVKSNCDRSANVSRPRTTFVLTGTETEQNPARIEWDMDGISQLRDEWYLDFVPINSRPLTNTPLDVTSLSGVDHADNSDPPQMLSIFVAGSLRINYSHKDKNWDGTGTRFEKLDPYTEPTECIKGWAGAEPKSVVLYSCNAANKTSRLSPLPYPDLRLSTTPNIRRHWVVEMAKSMSRVFVDGVHIASFKIPDEFFENKEFALLNTQASYNTGKDYLRDYVLPYVSMYHWDNFGFSGPADDTVVHNYIEGGPTGMTPGFGQALGTTEMVEAGTRTTIINIPDDIGSPKSAVVMLTLGNLYPLGGPRSTEFQWTTNAGITLNGHFYKFDHPRTNMQDPNNVDSIVGGYTPFAAAIPILKEHLVKGANTLKMDVGISTINVHLELTYDNTGSVPSYTQPTAIYPTYAETAHGPMTNCDQFWFVERDLGLLYQAGKTNLMKGECMLMGAAMPMNGGEHSM